MGVIDGFKKVYYYFSNCRKVHGCDNGVISEEGAIMKGCKVDIKGNGNKIYLGKNDLLLEVRIYVRGDNNRVHLGKNVRMMRGGEVWVEGNGCKIEIGDDTTMEQVHLATTEDGSKIKIGKDCLFANDIDVRTGDSHSLLDEKGNRFNNAADVEIGNHVWVGAHVSILKGSILADNCVVGTRSIVTHSMKNKSGDMLCGNPAKVIKENMQWKRERI